MPYQWLAWARRLQAISQNGLAYSTNPFDVERFEEVRAIAREILARHSDLDEASSRALFAGERGYATPKVDVRGFVRRGSGILLVKESADGLWSLPGGWADVNISPSEAVVKEILEESGYRARAVRLLALYDRNRHGHTPFPFHIYKLFFQCELLGRDEAAPDPLKAGAPLPNPVPPGPVPPGPETLDVGFFPLDSLPPLSTGRVTDAQILRLAVLADDPSSSTDFD